MVAIWRRWTRGASDLKRLLAGESGKGDVDSDVLLADLMIVLWKIVDWQKPKCCGREREEVGVGVSRGIYCVAAEEKPVSWAPRPDRDGQPQYSRQTDHLDAAGGTQKGWTGMRQGGQGARLAVPCLACGALLSGGWMGEGRELEGACP